MSPVRVHELEQIECMPRFKQIDPHVSNNLKWKQPLRHYMTGRISSGLSLFTRSSSLGNEHLYDSDQLHSLDLRRRPTDLTRWLDWVSLSLALDLLLAIQSL